MLVPQVKMGVTGAAARVTSLLAFRLASIPSLERTERESCSAVLKVNLRDFRVDFLDFFLLWCELFLISPDFVSGSNSKKIISLHRQREAIS